MLFSFLLRPAAFAPVEPRLVSLAAGLRILVLVVALFFFFRCKPLLRFRFVAGEAGLPLPRFADARLLRFLVFDFALLAMASALIVLVKMWMAGKARP